MVHFSSYRMRGVGFMSTVFKLTKKLLIPQFVLNLFSVDTIYLLHHSCLLLFLLLYNLTPVKNNSGHILVLWFTSCNALSFFSLTNWWPYCTWYIWRLFLLMLSDFCGDLLGSSVKITLEDFFNQRKKKFCTDRQADRHVDFWVLHFATKNCGREAPPPNLTTEVIPIF